MFRNKEISWFASLFTFITLILAALGFLINMAAGILVLVSAAVFGTAFFTFTKARYKSLAKLSQQIDRVLHNEDSLCMDELNEGELSILHSEITKMTLRIREQNEALRKDKTYLADSLADIAHQLRTPLTSANLIVSFLAENTDENERKSFVREAEELLVQMDWLLTSLLKISRLDAGVVSFQTEPVLVKELLDKALLPIAIPLELHGTNLRIDGPNEMKVLCDSGWLSQAIQNILKNCMESAGEGGTIEIICKDNPLFAEITIHDNGSGFKKEDLPFLFDRFYRGKHASALGYGIGLALSKMIITRQGGMITAKNHPEGGALFIIRFPK